MKNKTGKLYLIPSPLGDTQSLEVIPVSVKNIIEEINYFIVENEKTARRFIKKITPEKSQQLLNIEILNKHTEIENVQQLLTPCLKGINIGVISEAGCPGVADPGADIVALAHQKNIEVIPLVGPSSIILSLMASGFNGQNFAFNGYIPIDASKRKQTLKHLEKLSREQKQTQIFIETPYRNNKLLADIITTLNANTLLCIASNITLPEHFIKTLPISVWKKQPVDLHKKPTIFLIQA